MTDMPWPRIAEWLGFQIVWLACALGAANGSSLPGLFAAAAFVGIVLAAKRWDRGEILTIATSGVVGLIADSALVATGFVRYATPWPFIALAPAWMVALWLAFGATIATFSALLGKPVAAKSAIVGFLAGPLAYWAGAKVGAIEFGASWHHTLLAIALVWAFALPTLISLHGIWRRM